MYITFLEISADKDKDIVLREKSELLCKNFTQATTYGLSLLLLLFLFNNLYICSEMLLGIDGHIVL